MVSSTKERPSPFWGGIGARAPSRISSLLCLSLLEWTCLPGSQVTLGPGLAYPLGNTGPLCSILVGRFGCRVTVMLGGALASLGMVASSFCRTLSQLYLTAGFITGLGMCFSFQSSITVLGFYFSRHRALANALASVGVSLGITLWPLLSRYLLEDLGWRGTFLVFGGVFLHCCVCGAILRPVATSMAPETIEGPPPPSKTPAPGCLAACGRAIQRHLAFDILRHNAGYRVFTLGVMWMILGFPLPHVFLVPYAMRNGVDEHKAALLISIIGFSNIFLRPMAGLVAGRRDFAGHRKYLFSLAALLNGLTNLVCAVSADFRVLVGYCLVYSVSMSGIGALLFQVLMDIVPMDRFSSALGLFTILESISILISPPLAGEAPGGRAARCMWLWPGWAGYGDRAKGNSQQIWVPSSLSRGRDLESVIFPSTLGDWLQPAPQQAPRVQLKIRILLKDFIYLFIHERQREAETQTEGEAGTQSRDLGSHPEPKAEAQPLSHPGIPKIRIFVSDLPEFFIFLPLSTSALSVK
uniref:Solute carrier family 16 member 5 n=1 Tax=Canis lupus dingo TaxID=286419 RepID=A0A8C0R5J4_CANLU